MTPQQRILHITFMVCMSFALLLPQQYAYSQGVLTPLTRMALTGFAPAAGGYVRVTSAYSGVGGRVYSAAMNGGVRSIVATDARSIAVTGGSAAISTAASVSLKDAAIAIASCLGGGLICAAVSAAAVVYAAYRARQAASGGVEIDSGEPPVETYCNGWGSQPPVAAGGVAFTCDAQQYCTAYAATDSGRNGHGPDGWTGFHGVLQGTPNSYSYYCVVKALPPGFPTEQTSTAVQLGYGSRSITHTCRVPGASPGPDGLCPANLYQPVTPAQLGDAIVAHPPPWGSGEGGQFDGGGASGVWRDALKEAIEQGVQAPASIQNSGPASVVGNPTVTTETTNTAPTNANPNPTPQVTTNVNTPSSALQYPSGPFIPVTDTSTRQTTRPDGTVTTTQTTAPGVTPGPEPAPTDTALGPLPDLYTRKYPDGITGVWRDKSAAIRSTPLFSAAAGMFPNVGQGGTCPAWMLTVPGIGFDYGTYNVAPPCWIWDMAKWVVLISALLLCRALIFGG